MSGTDRLPDDLMRRVFTERELVLRPLVGRNAEALYALADGHREELRRYMTWVDRTTALADMTFHILSQDGFWKKGIAYGIEVDGVLHGEVGFHHSDMKNDRAEVGYWLAPPAQGKGYALRAVKMALEAAFRHTSVNRVEAKIHPQNLRSVTLVEKLGFHREGLEREGIKSGRAYLDVLVYSLLRRDFNP